MVRTNKHKTFTQETAVHVQCEIKSTVSYPKKKKKQKVPHAQQCFSKYQLSSTHQDAIDPILITI